MLKQTLLIFLMISTSAMAKWGEVKTIHRDSIAASGWNKHWLSSGDGKTLEDKKAVKRLVKLLAKTKAGRLILSRSRKKAKKHNKSLTDLISVGDHSITDTTLVRRFSANEPDKIHYESRSHVYINKSLSTKDALLDLAHELTHFATREAFNPYQSNFGLKDFIENTVAGKGGEVEAYLVECQVAFELFGRKKSSNDKCHLVTDHETGRLSVQKGRQQFYRLGDYYSEFSGHVHKHNLTHRDFTQMSGQDALFISSAYGMPYPLAAILEYESIMTKVCLNDEKRLGYLAKERSPASRSLYESKLDDHERRCAKFTQR